jgi:PadR family transcriptional regulator PadR
MNAQFKKGILELCVLAVLMRRECYGFELVNRVSRSIAMAEGTVYPLLKRLKDESLLTTYLVESTEGPPRKYYKLTREGVRHYEELLDEWKEFVSGVQDILTGEE